MIYAWWLPKRDIDPLIKKQLEMTTNMSLMEHKVGKETAEEILQVFKETQVDGSVLYCPQKLLKKGKRNEITSN